MPKLRHNSDINRDEQVYLYLFQLCGLREGEVPEQSKLVQIFGFKGSDRGNKFVKRLLDYFNDKNKPLPELSLHELIEILAGIENYFEDKLKNESDSDKYPKFITNQQKIRAIKKYCELTRDEKKQINLPVDFKIYIQESFIEDQLYSIKDNNEDTTAKDILADNTEGQKAKLKIDEKKLKKLIKENVIAELSEELEKANKTDLINSIISTDSTNSIINKVCEEIHSIIVQSGLENIHKIDQLLPKECNEKFTGKSFAQLLQTTIPKSTIKKLARDVINNIKLANQFFIDLKRIEVNKIEYLPLKNEDLSNEKLLDYLDEDEGDSIKKAIGVLKKRQNYKIKLHFILESKNNENKTVYINFVEEIIGISSILSLIRKGLNRAFFWDIPCLKDYFPIAQEVYLENILFGGDSLATVSSKSRVRLVKLKDLKNLLQEDYLEKHKDPKFCPTEDFDFDCYLEGSDIFEGSFTCFDLVESVAQSGLFARLKLLDEMNINPDDYRDQLEKRIKEQKSLLKGKKYLRSYPFSLLAMENHLQEKISDLETFFSESKPNETPTEDEHPSKIAYQAQFCIIQAYLTEGLYTKAEHELNKLENHVKYFNHFLKTDYYLCKAESLFLSDDKKKSRQTLITSCQENLKKAEIQLRLRILEFFRIGEISQSNVSPLFNYWARIAFLKAKLKLFFRDFVEKTGNRNLLLESLAYFGTARINAARDGDLYLSSQMALYQSWTYLIQAYLGNQPEGFDKKSCIDWAKRLLDQALIGYKDVSNEAYQDYMKKIFSESKIDNYDTYGKNLKIERPHLIRLVSKNQQKSNNQDDIDAELIKRKLLLPEKFLSFEDDEKDEKIDLFGQHSSLYYYAYGMLKLCDDYDYTSEEYSRTKSVCNELQDAFNHFFSALYIAYGIDSIDSIEDNNKKLDRNSDYIHSNSESKESQKKDDKLNVLPLKGLYFHRIIELVDLSKIFLALTHSIIATSKEDLERGKNFLGDQDDILTEVPIGKEFQEYAKHQDFYNIHLKEQFKRIKDYLLRECLTEPHNLKSSEHLLACRNERVTKIFRMLRGNY